MLNSKMNEQPNLLHEELVLNGLDELGVGTLQDILLLLHQFFA